MRNLKYIGEEIEKLKAEIDSYPLQSEDIRTSYLELTFSVLDLYYRQWCSIYSATIVKKNPPQVPEEERSIFEVFIDNVSHQLPFYSIGNNLNRSLLVDSWSTFEFCLTYLCESLFDQKVKEDLLNDDYRKINRALAKYKISEEDLRKVKKVLSKQHLTHLPVNRKYEKVHSLFKEKYKGDWDSDKTFLEFYGKYRNSLHTNYIYHGSNKEYTFLGTTYYFMNGEAVSHSEKWDITGMFNLALELKSICRRLFDAVQHPGLLPYPANKVIQPL